MNGKGNLANGFLHLVHTDITVEVAEDILQRTLLGNIAANILFFHHDGLCATTDKRGKDVLSSLDSNMGISESLVLDLHLILEETRQFMVGLRCIGCNTVFGTQFHFTDVAQLLIAWGWQAECVLETVLRSRVCRQEVVKALRQSGNHDNGILVPFIHLDKQFVKRVHLIGIAVWQQLLHIVEEQNAVLGFLHIIVPLVNEALIVHRVNHRQLRFLDNLMLVEVVANHFGQCCLTRSGLTYNNRIDA